MEGGAERWSVRDFQDALKLGGGVQAAAARLVKVFPATGHGAKEGGIETEPAGRGLSLQPSSNVLTIPGFKPHNEYYLDREICDVAKGVSPYNENFPAARNYTRLEDLLE